MVWYSHLIKNIPVCCDEQVKGFSIVSEAEVDVFLEFPSTIQQMARCSQIQIHGLLPKSNTVFL